MGFLTSRVFACTRASCRYGASTTSQERLSSRDVQNIRDSFPQCRHCGVAPHISPPLFNIESARVCSFTPCLLGPVFLELQPDGPGSEDARLRSKIWDWVLVLLLLPHALRLLVPPLYALLEACDEA